ncbi:MAG: hypothetical protein ACM335_02655 [Deltaproteobacteria bacterium]
MRRTFLILAAILVILLVLWLPSKINVLGKHTWLELTDAQSGRRITAQAVKDGGEVVLTWRNSIFDLRVAEVFVAREGRLDLTQVTFEDPRGKTPPVVAPEHLDDLYHTGGPFRTTGLSRPFTRIIFRVGEIGDPRLKVERQSIRLIEQVGFGGAVLLVTRKPGFFSLL